MTESNISLPSFRTKDMDDRFFFVGRLKEQVLETKNFPLKDGSGSFDKVSLRVVHERLDAEAVTPRYSFFPIPKDTIRPASPVGRYLTGMESAGTPIEFSDVSLDEANVALEEQLGNIYVLCNQAVGTTRGGREPDRFNIPLAKIGFGNDWDPDEAKRIIDEARSITPSRASRSSNGTAPKAQTIADIRTVSAPATASIEGHTMTVEPKDWKQAIVGIASGKQRGEATRDAVAWLTQNKANIPDAGTALAAVARGAGFWDTLVADGLVQIQDDIITAA